MRPLTPHSAFCARDHSSIAPASTMPERRCGSRPPASVVSDASAVAAGPDVPPGSREVSGHTASAVRAMAARVSPCPGRCGTVR
ncbi:hypothetical protein SALBM217S_07539 [Streptomyces griseoloalbus]